MDRDALEEFFAQAEDVLTDWDDSPDAMHVTNALVSELASSPVSPTVQALYERSLLRHSDQQRMLDQFRRDILAAWDTAPSATSYVSINWIDS